jgi:hypothetical protein
MSGKANSLMSKFRNAACAVLLFMMIVVLLGLFGYPAFGANWGLAGYLAAATVFATWIRCQSYLHAEVPAGSKHH